MKNSEGTQSKPALTPDHPGEADCSEYTLNANSCWITVGDVSVYIVRMNDGVLVETYPKSKAMDAAITSTHVRQAAALQPQGS